MPCPIKMDGLGNHIDLDNDNRCLSCNERLDGATPVGTLSPRPKDGDLSVCAYCGHLMAFNDDATLRELSSDEMYEAAGNPHILAIQRGRTRGMN